LATAPLRLARELGVPLVLEVNGLLDADAKTMYRSAAESLGTRIERRKLVMPDAIVTVSAGLADRLAALGANRETIFVVPNSVPDERVVAVPHVAGSSFVVGWIGHLMSWHADALLLLADVAPAVIKRVPEARFRIVGDGPRLSEIRERVSERGVADAFEFVGAVPYEEVPQALAEFDVGVIPDVFDYAFPVKLVEMGAAGIAVAAPHSKELNAMLRPDVDYQAFTRHDPGALEAAIVGLLTEPARRDVLAASLHAAVRDRFTWTSAAAGLREAVETALTD
jgi:glycosyltransferase involved in cell wall biosynthesis